MTATRTLLVVAPVALMVTAIFVTTGMETWLQGFETRKRQRSLLVALEFLRRILQRRRWVSSSYSRLLVRQVSAFLAGVSLPGAVQQS